MNEIIVKCPNCDELVIIQQINCGIFRHAVLISNNQQINPHASKIECENLINKKLIYGCGKPFKIIKNGEIFMTMICNYI